MQKAQKSIKGSYLLEFQGPCVYEWERNGRSLYIGVSDRVLGRIGRHQVVGVVEPVLADDDIRFTMFETRTEAEESEAKMLDEKQPKYNTAGTSKNRQSRRWRESDMHRI